MSRLRDLEDRLERALKPPRVDSVYPADKTLDDAARAAVRAIRKRKLYSVVCNANGCVFLRSGLGLRAAEHACTSHMAMTRGPTWAGHDVSMVKEKP